MYVVKVHRGEPVKVHLPDGRVVRVLWIRYRGGERALYLGFDAPADVKIDIPR